MTTTTTLEELCQQYGVTPDKHGEAHIPCPNCGKEPKRGATHCSFSAHGWYCFVCGEGGSLASLASENGVEVTDYQRPAPKPTRSYYWKEHGAETLASITAMSEEQRLAAWQEYKPVTLEMVREHHLGVGVLPASRCHHKRLLVPLLRDGQLVGIRGRAIDCDCGKWLSPGGNEAVLYNADALGQGKDVWIVENPIDALLLTDAGLDVVAVATLSIVYLLPRGSKWNRPEWVASLRAANPQQIVVAYDNHRPGNGKGRAEWMATHDRDIEPNGIRLANGLRHEGLNALLLDWEAAPIGADVGNPGPHPIEYYVRRMRHRPYSNDWHGCEPRAHVPLPKVLVEERPGRRRLMWSGSEVKQPSNSISVDELREHMPRIAMDYAYSDSHEPLLMRVPAGGGKTYTGIQIAQELAMAGYRVLWASPRHDLYNEMAAANPAWDSNLWYHWQAMTAIFDSDTGETMCRYCNKQKVWMDKGYRAFELCKQVCTIDGWMAACPYRAQALRKEPIIFAMHEHLATGLGLRDGFDIAIIDEMPANAFLDARLVLRGSLEIPDVIGPVADLVDVLIWLSEQAEEQETVFSGKSLFDKIGPVLIDVFAQIEIDENAIPQTPVIFSADDVQTVPHFWLPQFLLIAEPEWECWSNEWPLWVERLEVDAEGLKVFARHSRWEDLPLKIIALDATADEEYYRKLLEA